MRGVSIRVWGKGRFLRAWDAWSKWLAQMEVDNRVGGVGSGPLGFASFTFDPDESGSVVAAPALVVGRRGRRAWITTVGDLDPVSFAQAPISDAELPDRPRYVGCLSS